MRWRHIWDLLVSDYSVEVCDFVEILAVLHQKLKEVLNFWHLTFQGPDFLKVLMAEQWKELVLLPD